MLKRIYAVDDDADVRASLLSLLTAKTDVAVQCFGSGDAFLYRAPELEPGVILLDMNMPGASGLEVLHKLVEQGSKFVSIVVTGERRVQLAVQAMQAGAIDFLEKPYAPEALLQAIDAAFEQLAARNRAEEQTRECREKIARLSPRERHVLVRLLQGCGNKETAKALDISPRTIEVYRANLMKKLGVRTLAETLRVAMAAGLTAD